MELMIVIIIIGILAAVGLVLFGDFSLKAKKDQSNLFIRVFTAGFIVLAKLLEKGH